MRNKWIIKKGFSLLEILIAISTFAFLVVIFFSIFSNSMKHFVSIKNTQKNTESAQYALNLMTKTLRTSTLKPSVDGISSNTITMYDNSQGACVIYKYEGGKLQMATASGTDVTDIAKCNTNDAPSLGVFSDLTRKGEILSFFVEGSSLASGAGVKSVTILMSTKEGDTIQATVSLRN